MTAPWNPPVGAYLETVVVSGSAVSLTTATAANVGAGISLPGGDWDVTLSIVYTLSGATTTETRASVSATSATHSSTATANTQTARSLTTATGTIVENVGPVRIAVPGQTATTFYAVASATFSAGTVTAYGTIRARRMG